MFTDLLQARCEHILLPAARKPQSRSKTLRLIYFPTYSQQTHGKFQRFYRTIKGLVTTMLKIQFMATSLTVQYKAQYTRKRFPAFLYFSLFSRESRTTSSLLETIQKRRKTFPCVRGLIVLAIFYWYSIVQIISSFRLRLEISY